MWFPVESRIANSFAKSFPVVSLLNVTEPFDSIGVYSGAGSGSGAGAGAGAGSGSGSGSGAGSGLPRTPSWLISISNCVSAV